VENYTLSELSVILIYPSQAKASPDDLRGKIFMMIEYYPDTANPIPKKKEEEDPDSNSSSSSSDSDFSDSEQAQNMKAFHQTHKGESAKVHPQLAALGVYAQSIKPKGNWLVQELLEPFHALINISESGISKLLPHSLEGLVGDACKHLRRCYPRGTRVGSSNMDPLPVWRAGTQVAALNVHVWDLGTQLNAALFEGSQGWVLKPESLRGGNKRSGEVTFKVEVIGADDGQYLFVLVCPFCLREERWAVPNPTNKNNPATYFIAELFTPEGTKSYNSKTVDDHSGDPMWNETVEWKYEDAELVFFQCATASSASQLGGRHC
jgi:phosphatidylinositol phospholipase C delta